MMFGQGVSRIAAKSKTQTKTTTTKIRDDRESKTKTKNVGEKNFTNSFFENIFVLFYYLFGFIFKIFVYKLIFWNKNILCVFF